MSETVEMDAELFDATPLENQKHCRCYWKNREYNWMEKVSESEWRCPCGIVLRHIGFSKYDEPKYVWENVVL